MNGRQETVDGRPALVFDRHLDHPLDRVWRAVTEPAELERWFVATAPWTPVLGETFEAAGQSGQITELEEPQLLAWTWGAELYRFELAATDSGCVLTFTHVFDPALGPAAQHAAGWETYFNRLDAHLAGDHLSEQEAHEAFPELHRRYSEAFG